jgi:hypothetical protein
VKRELRRFTPLKVLPSYRWTTDQTGRLTGRFMNLPLAKAIAFKITSSRRLLTAG